MGWWREERWRGGGSGMGGRGEVEWGRRSGFTDGLSHRKWVTGQGIAWTHRVSCLSCARSGHPRNQVRSIIPFLLIYLVSSLSFSEGYLTHNSFNQQKHNLCATKTILTQTCQTNGSKLKPMRVNFTVKIASEHHTYAKLTVFRALFWFDSSVTLLHHTSDGSILASFDT